MKQLMNINPEKLSELLINSSNINSMFYIVFIMGDKNESNQ